MEKPEFKTFESCMVKCACYGHMFEIERYEDRREDDKTETGFNLVTWERGRDGKILCWRERWRWIWNIIRTGQLWADDIIINDNQAKEIVEYINKHLPKE